jgi:hypothetical protein
MDTNMVATTSLFWKAILLSAAIDLVLVGLLAWRTNRQRFRRLGRTVALVSLVFWGCMWLYAVWGPWWNLAYRFIFPEWGRFFIPPLYALLFGAAGFGIWWLAQHIPGHPVVNFCLLGGLLSLPGHLVAIYACEMFEKVPLLREASPAVALLFGIFEFTAYFGLILALALLVDRLRRERQSKK